MVEITSQDELRKWLRDKPDEWAQVIAARAALRALPLFISEPNDMTSRVAIFRAVVISWAARNYPAHDMKPAANHAFSALRSAADFAALSPSNSASLSAGLSSGLSAGLSADFTDSAALSVAASATATTSGSIYWNAVKADADWLVAAEHPAKNAARELTARSLWPDIKAPKVFEDAWVGGVKRMRSMETNFAPWIEWFSRRITGENTAFLILGDKRRKEDKAILRKLADATDKGFWDLGPKHVNATLQQWLDEARKRAAGNLKKNTKTTNRFEVVSKLEKMASPQSQIVDGKLDAGPNETFDQPEYSGNLADLPAELRSFLNVLSKSLGPNASAFMRASLEEYSNELLVRGNRPIIGTLKGLSSAIGRELWDQNSVQQSDDPQEWELRSNSEWSAGEADLFRTFFAYHIDLIRHFPLDQEREEILENTPVDEEAATGNALTDPIESVTQLIRDLHEQGAATDDILKIVNAHAQYNANIASLPPPTGIAPPTDYVSPKRRHVLMTTGFYQRLYNVLGSSASITSVVVTPGLMIQLQAAVEALLQFIF